MRPQVSDSGLCDWLIMAVQQMPMSELGCVGVWLQDLRQVTDSECMCVLQGKSLSRQSADVILPAKKSLKDNINMLRQRSNAICNEFSKLLSKLEKDRWHHVQSGALRLTCQIRSLLHEFTYCEPQPLPQFIMNQQVVMTECAKLAQYIESNLDDKTMNFAPKMAVTQLLSHLRQSFMTLIDGTLGMLIKDLLLGLKDSSYRLKTTLHDLLAIALEDNHMCVIITKECGVELLLEVCRCDQLRHVHVSALRVIATLCRVAESVIKLAELGGLQYLSAVLEDSSVAELVRSEAAGVIAQVTSPSLNHYQFMDGFIEYSEELIKSLTLLCAEASRPEVLLVSCAALANITFIDNIAGDLLLTYHTASVLIHILTTHRNLSIFTKDQVVTVLANMATAENCSAEILGCGGAGVLVALLDERVTTGGENEMRALERLQQKAAIALTRLCQSQQAAKDIVNENAVAHLIEICKNAEARNGSDAVLNACMVALRTIVDHHGLQGEPLSADLRTLLISRTD